MKFLRFSTILMLLTIYLVPAMAQEDEKYEPIPDEESVKPDKKWDWSRARVGGNFGMQFGTITYVDISPTFGYYVVPNKLQVGIGSKFVFYNQRDNIDFYQNGVYVGTSLANKQIIGGGSVFTEYDIWKGLFAYGEYGLVNKEPYDFFNPKDRINVSSLLLGAGYNQPIGNAGNFYISALFDVINSDESIYTGTFGTFPLILRIGFGFGFGGKK